MRGRVVVNEVADFETWLKTHPTYAQTLSGEGAATATDGLSLIEQGQKLSESHACVACHSLDGSTGIGPTWQGLFGKTETLADGTTVIVDADYLKESILNPNAKMVEGYQPLMPPSVVTDEELDALIAYIRDGLGE
ncbi:MAG: cytochrome c [Spongiibacteraceae bacterium]|nr:cytochrome c [Spongiibacteraceae bacterium]